MAGEGGATSYTLDSSNFTTAVGGFDRSVERLENLLSGGVWMTHSFQDMNVSVTVGGEVEVETDTEDPALASTIREAVNEGINTFISNNFPDLPRQT